MTSKKGERSMNVKFKFLRRLLLTEIVIKFYHLSILFGNGRKTMETNRIKLLIIND